MKRNIDLTDTMIFSRQHINIGINLRHLEKSLGRKIHLKNPNEWLQGEQKDSIIDRKLQVIPLGDREERTFIKECLEMDSENYCDCCGTYLLNKPWDRTYSLCRRCAVQLEDTVNHRKGVPWGRVQGMTANRNNIV